MATVQKHDLTIIDRAREALGWGPLQTHDLSTLDKVRMGVGLALSIIAAPFLLFVAVIILAQIAVLCALLITWLIRSIF